MDEYWKSALAATLDLVPHTDIIFTPGRFFNFSRKFYPLEFSSMRTAQSVGFCVQKSLLHRIDARLVEAICEPAQVVYSNDVFFVAAVRPPQSLHWAYFEESRFKEYMSARESVMEKLMGRNTTRYWRVEEGSGSLKVLIVGATHMGNIGDDLIALSIGRMVRDVSPNCSISFIDSRVTRADIEDFDIVIVGGGGIVYSSQFGQNETDNLANYLKIPLWLQKLPIPCLVMGVGIQGRRTQFERDPIVERFLTESLSAASDVIVRDTLSEQVLSRYASKPITVLPDPVFNFGEEFDRYRTERSRPEAERVAFIGEIYSERLSFFNQILRGDAVDFFRLLGDRNVVYFVMSNDDVSHGERFVKMLAERNIECETRDLRDQPISAILDLFADISALVTTRFHGLVLSLLAGCPALSVDLSSGKHGMLINDHFPSLERNTINEKCDYSSVIKKLEAIVKTPVSFVASSDEVDRVVATTNCYRDTLQSHISLMAKIQ